MNPALYFILLIIIFSFTMPANAQQNWVLTNGPYGGESINAIVKDTSGNIYMGTSSGGVYKSSDFGSNWIKKINNMGNKNVNALLITPNNLIFAGTKEYEVGRIYKSDDFGENWNQVMYSSQIYCLAVSPDGWIYAGTFNDGMLMSTNNGITWGQYDVGSNKAIYSIYFKEGYVFANTEGDGVFRSTTYGITWEQKNNGLEPSSGGWIYIEPGVVKSNGDIFVSGYTLLYKSTNNGDHWSIMSVTSMKQLEFDLSENYLYGGFPNYSGNGGMKQSSDNGATWNDIGLQGKDVISFLLDGDSVIYTGTNGNGLFRKDLINDWTQLFNIGSIPVRTNILRLSPDSLIFAGTQWWGLYYTSDYGNEWIKTGLPNMEVESIAFAKNGYVFAGYIEVYRSTNKDSTFEKVSDNSVFNIYIDKNDFVYLCTNDGIIKSTDYGDSWGIWADFGQNVFVRDVFQVEDSTYIATYNNHTVKTTDNGVSWQTLTNIEMHDFQMDSYGRIYARSGGKIYTSTNSGNIWLQMNIQIFGGYQIEAIWLDSDNMLFAAKYNRIYKTSDLGNTWIGIPGNGNAWSIWDILPLDSLIFACNDDGVYKRDQDYINSTENYPRHDYNYDLEQNFPNPFNSLTNIKYTIQKPSRVTIKVFDLLGREIGILVNELKQAGSYEIVWDAGDLPSGIYIYRLQSDSFTESRKMLLLK